MLSSISSSDPPGGRAPWGAVWAGGLAAALLLLAGLELFWRAGGYVPSVIDDADLWAFERSRIRGDTSSTVALIGASRMQMDMAMPVLRSLLKPRRIVQLAIAGNNAGPVLSDLANDRNFRGIVVSEAIEYSMPCGQEGLAADYVRHYHKGATFNTHANRWIRSLLQGHWVFLKTGLNPLRLLKTGQCPKPEYVITRPDRSRVADYTMTDAARMRAASLADYDKFVPLDPEAWLEQCLKMKSWVEAIQTRGGNVVLLRFPTGPSEAVFARKYPRAEYWDRFVRATEVPAVYFDEVPGLGDFDCPDGSHIDKRDAPRFTGLVISNFAQRGFWTLNGWKAGGG